MPGTVIESTVSSKIIFSTPQGLENDIIPDPRSDRIEEARLVYVSMMRAKEKLYLFHSFRRPRKISYGDNLINKERSEFLDALGKESEFHK